jgi:hypothetical protein
MNQYKITLFDLSDDPEGTQLETKLEAASIREAVRDLKTTVGYRMTFGQFNPEIVMDGEKATITCQIGRVEVERHIVRTFVVDCTQMPKVGTRGNPVIESEADNIDQIISAVMAAALMAGFIWNELAVDRVSDHEAYLNESVVGSRVVIRELL